MKRIVNLKWLALLTTLYALLPCASGADRITATVTITNTAVNDDTFIVNAATRTWKTSVTVPASQIATGADAEATTTNLVAHLFATPFASVTVYALGATSFRLDALTGVALAVSGAGDYFEVTYSTQTVATAYDVIVPYTSMPSVRRQTITEGIVDWLNLASGKALFENSASVSNLVGRTNSQSISGPKQFTDTNTFTKIITTNLDVITGAVINNLIGTNGQNYGSAFRSPGSGTASEQFGTSASAGGDNATALGNQADASGDAAIALGNQAGGSGNGGIAIGSETQASDTDAVALGTLTYATAWDATALGAGAVAAYDGSTALGALAASTKANQVRIGLSSDTVSMPGFVENLQTRGTNSFSDIAFRRLAITSLANGNNAGVVVGTNTFVEVSGPSAAFTLNGMTGSPSRDGHLVIIVNQTGFDWTVAHQSGTDPVAANRIITMTGADRTTTGNGAATFIYSAAAARWLLISFDP